MKVFVKALIAVGAIAAATAAAAAVIFLPAHLLPTESADWKSLKPIERFQLEASYRTVVVQTLGALILVLGAVTGVRQLNLNRQLKIHEEEKANAADFAAAISALNDDVEFVRISGLLRVEERMQGGNTSIRDKAIQVLVQYVRQFAARPGARASTSIALSVLAETYDGATRLDLSNLDLHGYDLTAFDVNLVKLDGSDLRDTGLDPSSSTLNELPS